MAGMSNSTNIMVLEVLYICQHQQNCKLMTSLVCSQVKSVRRAEENGVPVDHPLLDNVRACSSTPHAAAAFFSAVLHPSPTSRLTSAQALQHPYLRRCVAQMKASYNVAQTPASACTSKPDSSVHSADILGKLASVPSSGFKMMKSLVSQVLPGNSSSSRSQKARMRDMARYFPDYVHPSSDAELSAYQPCILSDAASPAETSLTDVRQLMAGMNQLRADFNLKPAVVAPATPVAAVSPGLHVVMRAKASPGADSTAAALQLQRQLYPTSPLSASPGFIPALHSAHAQPFGSCESKSDAVSGQEHFPTHGQEAVESTRIPLSSPTDEPQPGSTRASRSTLHMKQAQAPSAQAASGSPGSAALPPAAVSGALQAEEDRLHSQQIALLPGGTGQADMEQQHSGMQEMLTTEPEAEPARCLLTADTDAAGDSGNRATNVGDSEPGLFSQESLVSHGAHRDQLRSRPIHVEPKDEEEVHRGHLRSHPVHFEPKDEEEVASVPASRSVQSPHVEISDQAHVQLPDQNLGALQNVEDIAVRTPEKSLKSHALQFPAGYDEDLDEPDPSDVDKSGSGSNCNFPGMEDADVDPNPYRYLNQDVPLQQARQLQIPLYRYVATAAYLMSSPCPTFQSMPMQVLWRLVATLSEDICCMMT